MTARIRSIAVLVLLLTTALAAAGADPAAPPLTAKQALGALKAGNDRFARNASKPVSTSVLRRDELSKGQHPLAMVLSCADARVPPELIFNTNLGDLLVVRTAGAVVDRSVLATVEYGATALSIPLLVVMGHESCDAVKAAADAKGPGESANLEYLYHAIQTARRQVAAGEDRQEREELKALVLASVEEVINDTMARSPALRRLVAAGKLEVVGGYYELVSGRVMFSDPVPSSPAPPVPSPAASPAVRK